MLNGSCINLPLHRMNSLNFGLSCKGEIQTIVDLSWKVPSMYRFEKVCTFDLTREARMKVSKPIRGKPRYCKGSLQPEHKIRDAEHELGRTQNIKCISEAIVKSAIKTIRNKRINITLLNTFWLLILLFSIEISPDLYTYIQTGDLDLSLIEVMSIGGVFYLAALRALVIDIL